MTDPGVVDPDYFRERFGIRLTQVGTVSEGSGVWLQSVDGTVGEVDAGGFDHWESE